MLSEERSTAISACIIKPKEDKHTQRELHIVLIGDAIWGLFKRKYIQHGERKGYVELRKHGISPVVYRVFLLQVEFTDEEIYYRQQVGNKDNEV